MIRLGATCLLLSLTLSHAATTVDDLGRRVSIPQVAQRIVTLAPHATELVMAAGAGDRLVGIAAGSTEKDRLSRLPRIGGPGGLDREALLELQPDLVIAWQSGNRATDLDWIARNGIALYRTEPGSLSDIARAMRDIGSLSGTARQAGAAARAFEQTLDTPCGRLPPQPAYVSVWEHPAMTVGGRHWINAVLRSAGYRNVFDHLDRGVFAVSPEAALAHQELPRISLVRRLDRGEDDRLADLLSRPGPGLGEAVRILCNERLAQESAETHSGPPTHPAR